MRFIEVSHPISPGMRTYPGLPEPRVEVLRNYEASFYIASLHLCGNTGTYIDAPIHRYRDGASLAELPLERLANLPILLVEGTELPRLDFRGRAVLFRTGWSKHFGTEQYASGHPFLVADTCQRLVDGGAAFVGIDSLNIDDTRDASRPAHTLLLGAGIPICEHMTNLHALNGEGRLHAVPIAWLGGASFPVRAYVMTQDQVAI